MMTNWQTGSPWRILWACQSRVTGPLNVARFMTAASTSQRRARSAALNAPYAVQLSRIGTLLGFLDIDSLPAQLGMPNDNPSQTRPDAEVSASTYCHPNQTRPIPTAATPAP